VKPNRENDFGTFAPRGFFSFSPSSWIGCTCHVRREKPFFDHSIWDVPTRTVVKHGKWLEALKSPWDPQHMSSETFWSGNTLGVSLIRGLPRSEFQHPPRHFKKKSNHSKDIYVCRPYSEESMARVHVQEQFGCKESHSKRLLTKRTQLVLSYKCLICLVWINDKGLCKNILTIFRL